MFQHGPSAFDPRLNAIAEQLRAIEKQLGGISKTASDRAAATASSRRHAIYGGQAARPRTQSISAKYWQQHVNK